MAFSIDGEFAHISALIPPPPARGDWRGIRRDSNAALEAVNSLVSRDPRVLSRDYAVAVTGESETILVRWYTRQEERPGAALVYFHGGGMISGSVDLYDNTVAQYTEKSGVPVLSVDYRLAPEHPGTTPVEDGLAALRWLVDRADDLGVDPERIAVIGDSGGGGVAAGVAIAARDRGIQLARQILIYPMLDDRNTVPDPELEPFAFWSYEGNFTGWQALLGEAIGTPNVSPLSAPARLTDFSGLAPAFIDVGELDIFRDESIHYALQLYQAGVSTELHVRPGAPHGFDGGGGPLGQQGWADRLRVISAL